MCDRVIAWMFGFSYANNIRFIAVLLRRVDIDNVSSMISLRFIPPEYPDMSNQLPKKKPGESQAFDV